MKTIIIILMILSAFDIKVTYTNGRKTDWHFIPAIIALILFCINY